MGLVCFRLKVSFYGIKHFKTLDVLLTPGAPLLTAINFNLNMDK